MVKPTLMERPKRWDEPFGPELTADEMLLLQKQPEIAGIRADKFPSSIPLAGILKNDTRIMRYKLGDIVVREGDYGNSAFLILQGKLRVVVAPSLPKELEGRHISRKRNWRKALSQIWTNRKMPEVRDTQRYRDKNYRKSKDAQETRVFLQDIPAILSAHKTAVLEKGALFGELAALGRIPRTATVFTDSTEAVLLEIRWQGLRELRKYDEGWRRMIDERYRENALKAHLKETPLFSGLNTETLQLIADQTLFETYGKFDWNVTYQRLRREGTQTDHEPVMAKQGDYRDGLLLIRAGFARVSVKLGHGERTLTYLGKGDYFAFDELYASWKEKKDIGLETTLSAIGYVDVLRVPTKILEDHVFPKIKEPPKRLIEIAKRPVAEDALMAWAVEERFINATQAMVIDLDLCTRCDDCVRACASTHDGNPRFIRHGKKHDHWMVANACMHCADPVCMIGCPTGAIHRIELGGDIVINDDTCIGCGMCANSCPYDNIRMVNIRDLSGNMVVDPQNQNPIMKATKCDLCEDQLGGPACQRACPHDALKRTDFIALLNRSQSKT